MASFRNPWLEASSATIDKLMHNLQERQLTNSSPEIPFNLIFAMIRGSVNEITILQGKVNALNDKNKELLKQIEELQKKTE